MKSTTSEDWSNNVTRHILTPDKVLATHRLKNWRTAVRFRFSKAKSEVLRKNPKRGIGFEEAQEILSRSARIISVSTTIS